MSAPDIAVNLMTATVPVLLIVVGSNENIHLLSAYYEQRERGRAKPRALRQMAERTGLAVMLTSATTFLGFLSVSLAGRSGCCRCKAREPGPPPRPPYVSPTPAAARPSAPPVPAG